MEKYYEITGYWNLVGEHNFNEKNKWQGQVILNENGWFEGVAHDFDSSKTTCRLIFGLFKPGQGIYLYKMAPRTLCEPQIINGTYNEDYLEGELYAISFRGTQSIGVSRIKTNEIAKEQLPEDFNEQIEEAKTKTEGASFYDSLYSKLNNKNKKLQLVRTNA